MLVTTVIIFASTDAEIREQTHVKQDACVVSKVSPHRCLLITKENNNYDGRIRLMSPLPYEQKQHGSRAGLLLWCRQEVQNRLTFLVFSTRMCLRGNLPKCK